MKTSYSYCKEMHAVCVTMNPGGITLPIYPSEENLQFIEHIVHRCGRFESCKRGEAFSPKEETNGKCN